MAAVRDLGFVMRVLGPPMHKEHLVVFITAKFGWNRCRSFDNMHVFRFREFGLKNAHSRPKIGGLGFFDPLNGEPCEKCQKGTSLRESASFEPSFVNIRRGVWPVGEFFKKGINKNNFGYISPMCPEVPRRRMCT